MTNPDNMEVRSADMHPLSKSRVALGPSLKRPTLGLASVALGLLLSAGVAIAAANYFHEEISRTGNERNLRVELDAPFGSVNVSGGTKNNVVVVGETDGGDKNSEPSIHLSYSMHNKTEGVVKIDIGKDEGMVRPTAPLAIWWARNPGFSFTTANAVQSDMGGNRIYGERPTFVFPPVFLPMPTPQNLRAVPIPSSEGHPATEGVAKIVLTKELPMTLHAELGFGQSDLDLTGLGITALNVETGASKSRVIVRQPNPQVMATCQVNAGLGECRLLGIANFNAQRFSFSGGFGAYELGFQGHLSRNMDASITLGVGKCMVNIPPDCGRVQVYYEDGILSSFLFQGLTKRREGCYTSVGFEQSTAPILTLHLSSGMGKMTVNYR